ncbi:MAG TPA: hypothetical protein PL064_01610, partial [Thermogutta sp.]|nr:hypothetical protein [Thermogutta sp.]
LQIAPATKIRMSSEYTGSLLLKPKPRPFQSKASRPLALAPGYQHGTYHATLTYIHFFSLVH